ncbi:MAG: CoA ester lyase [Actinomycetota bacterium]|jgi:citrate lyase subunit beta/citryl-CoA lyase|nr:CoA ester lyase [Actinomycetota bacterium]MDA8279351.1 CoA ester lyase [Actinomycetota bacterium]
MSAVGDQGHQPAARSYLYVPASSPELIDKALAGRADAVVLDLEDAVPPDRKVAARANAAAVLRAPPPKALYVRVNGLASGLMLDDLAAVASPHLAGVRVPKAEDGDGIRTVRARLDAAGCNAVVVPIIESALGVERAFDIASAHPSVATLAMGEADLRADLHATADDALDFARSRCVLAARAARRLPAIQSVHTQLGDEAGLRASTERGRALGFGARSAVHPAQVPVINDVLSPSEAERERAAAIVSAYRMALAQGLAVTTLDDGQFIDEPVARDAADVLARAALPRD